ncbi:Pentatricopeptide repeat-containing protein [Forsythia ovata]|uniref:Pentatricopeptide repeat-containing protein n=1 Tax=Forsythia ovata TaxID=205694 RepID=A0ABD1SQ96_9LAMI
MAFSSCLKCHSWTHSHNLEHPFLSTSKSIKIISFPFLQNHEKQFSSLSASTSSPPSATSLSPDFTTKQLLETLRRENNEDSALRLFEWASKQPNFTPTLPVYEEVLRKLGIAGSFHMIGRVLDDMKRSGVEIVEGTFFILIDSYAKFGFYDKAIGVLDMMENEFGVKPGTHSYNSLLNVLVDGNKLILG